MATSRAGGSGASTTITHGVKRSAPDPPENDQRLAKRFDLLNLDHHGKRYIPVAAQGQREIQQTPPPNPRIESQTGDDFMQVEDTPHKVYIYDLDKELADIESDEENPIFLPDIEKRIGKIPQHILQHRPELKPTSHNQLVLYNVPSSLTIPEEQDKVRRAIEEARDRIKAQQATLSTDFRKNHAAEPFNKGTVPSFTEGNMNGNGYGKSPDPEAMDIEEL